MGIKAIETRYAGCRFRSRLEARWAVFFDTLNIRWEHEPQGYMINDLAGSIWSGPYLPDFRLAAPFDGWAEVKGDPTLSDVRKAAAAVIPHGGLPGERLWLLGSFGRPDHHPASVLLKFHKGDVLWSPPHREGEILANDAGSFDLEEASAVLDWWREAGVRFPASWKVASRAIRAARSARFEHGEQG